MKRFLPILSMLLVLATSTEAKVKRWETAWSFKGMPGS